MTPALADLAPEAVPGVRLLPVVHGRIELAVLVRGVLDALDPAAVAVELPASFAEAVGAGLARLPRVSLVLAEEPGEEAVVWAVAPGDPFVEALRWAVERGRPWYLVDPDLPYRERHADAVPDPYALLEIGPHGYLAPLVAAADAAPAEAADRQREAGMAYHLGQALAELRGAGDADGSLLALVGAAHARRLAAELARPQAIPLARVRRSAAELRHLHPRSLTALLADPPLAHAAWELLRRDELPPEPALDEAAAAPLSLARAGLTLLTRESGEDASERRSRVAAYAAHRASRPLPGTALPAPDRRALGRVVWEVAARSHERQARETVAPWQRRTFFDFAARLARVEGQLAAGLYGWVVAARGVGDDNLAWETFEAARAYPWQEEAAEIPTAEVDGSELRLHEASGTRKVRFRRRFFRVKRRPVAVPVRERATTDDPAEWLAGFAGGGLCSYPPEDLVIEDFGRYLRARAVGLLAAERERVEPFSTGLLDGIDVRETLRHFEDPGGLSHESLAFRCGAVGSDSRRRDASDAVASLRSGNAVDGPTPPQPEGRRGVAGVSRVARRRRCYGIDSSSRLGSTPQDPCAEGKGFVTQTTRIWVRELGRSPGEAGSVVAIFDRDLPEEGGAPRFPHLMTWLGERHDESDMAFYSTHPGEQVVGPGILRATYGGFAMTLPPGRLFDVWRDPDYRQFEEKADVLLAAAIDYSEEPLVVHLAERPPKSALSRYAKAQGKRIVHVPLGALSPATLRKVRVLHILVGRDKRRIAADYVW